MKRIETKDGKSKVIMERTEKKATSKIMGMAIQIRKCNFIIHIRMYLCLYNMSLF